MGQAFHVEGRKTHEPEVHRQLLDEIGFGADVLDQALDDPTTADEVRADHEVVVAKGGFGVPTLVFADGQALFGPVVAPAVSGAEAERLWDLTVGWLRVPAPLRDAATQDARRPAPHRRRLPAVPRGPAWPTIANPTP